MEQKKKITFAIILGVIALAMYVGIMIKTGLFS
jgi:hypothetical protein